MPRQTSSAPLVSVLMTAYNREAYVGAAIESVLASTLDDFELIVVDDGSSDRTVEIARGYAARDRRVQVHVNEVNLGDYPNRNRAASLARGKYLKYLDSDDLIYPHGLGVMVHCMERAPDAAYGLGQPQHAARAHPFIMTPREAYRANFFEWDVFGRGPGSAIIRAEAFRAVQGFSGRRFVGDQELWLVLSRGYAMTTMPRDLTWDRVHAAQERVSEGESALGLRRRLELESIFHPDAPFTPQERKLAAQRVDRRFVVEFWRRAMRVSPVAALEFWRAAELPWRALGLAFHDPGSVPSVSSAGNP